MDQPVDDEDDLMCDEVTHSSHRKKCGFCGVEFSSVDALYAHQQEQHDPDGLAFSELGLPK